MNIHADKRVPPPERPAMVLLMLFVLAGPLALPMLWQSPYFSRPWKIVLSILVVLIAIFAVWLLWYLGKTFLEPLLERWRRL